MLQWKRLKDAILNKSKPLDFYGDFCPFDFILVSSRISFDPTQFSSKYSGFLNTGKKLWDSSAVLALLVSTSHNHFIKGKRVIELGAGCFGLAGLAAAMSGACRVLLTDGNPECVQILQTNIKNNQFLCKVDTMELLWGNNIEDKFDTVLVADWYIAS